MANQIQNSMALKEITPMKLSKLFNLPIKYLLIGISALLAVAIVVVCCFGFNTSIEFGGGSQIKIDITETSNRSEMRNNLIV